MSGGEISAALAAGFAANGMVYSGVGKTDPEINLGLDNDIYSFNVESVPELEVINELAGKKGKVANISIRVNPDIDAHTHRYITTGTAEDKFGINIEMLSTAVNKALSLPNIHLRGLHFHVGSQITDMKPFSMLCDSVNGLLDYFDRHDIHFEMINVGGGLGIDYVKPDVNTIPDFEHFFNTFKHKLKLRKGQELHFELGRSIVAQCGSLIARVVFVKENRNKKFVILDAGMTDLIRPALYEAPCDSKHLVTRHCQRCLRCGWAYLRVKRRVCPRREIASIEARRHLRHSLGRSLWRNHGVALQHAPAPKILLPTLIYGTCPALIAHFHPKNQAKLAKILVGNKKVINFAVAKVSGTPRNCAKERSCASSQEESGSVAQLNRATAF